MTRDAALPRSTLKDHLDARCPDEGLKDLIVSIAEACAEISHLVRRGPLGGDLGAAAGDNVQGEVQKALDVIANDVMIRAAERSGAVAGCASEELEDVVQISPDGRLLLLFDPLDGSSNIDVNVSIGTIFSVLRRPLLGTPAEAGEFMQKGRLQAAAGYAVYGPQTSLVFTLGDGVFAFTLDPEGLRWVLTGESLKVSQETREFAINMSNQRHWAAPIQRYVAECLEGKTGVRGKDFNMRWVASMVADVHRILSRGGVFLYPWDAREPDRAGKLRLMYEANPLGFVMEQAGGAASDGETPILDLQPTSLHQRVSVVLGAKEEVGRVAHLAQTHGRA